MPGPLIQVNNHSRVTADTGGRLFCVAKSELRSIPQILHPPIVSHEHRMPDSSEGIHTGGGGSARSSELDGSLAGLVDTRPVDRCGHVWSLELVDATVVTLEGDDVVPGEGIAVAGRGSSRFRQWDTDEGSEFVTIPTGVVVRDQVDAFIDPVDDGVDVAGERVDVGVRRASGIQEVTVDHRGDLY